MYSRDRRVPPPDTRGDSAHFPQALRQTNPDRMAGWEKGGPSQKALPPSFLHSLCHLHLRCRRWVLSSSLFLRL